MVGKSSTMNLYIGLYLRHKHIEGLWAKPETIFEAMLQNALREWMAACENEENETALGGDYPLASNKIGHIS